MSGADTVTSALHSHRTTPAGVCRKELRFTGPASERQTEVNPWGSLASRLSLLGKRLRKQGGRGLKNSTQV